VIPDFVTDPDRTLRAYLRSGCRVLPINDRGHSCTNSDDRDSVTVGTLDIALTAAMRVIRPWGAEIADFSG
jgi:hypothetical protein